MDSNSKLNAYLEDTVNPKDLDAKIEPLPVQNQVIVQEAQAEVQDMMK